MNEKRILIQIYEDELRQMIREECQAALKEVLAQFSNGKDEKYIGTKEAAQLLGVTSNTIRDWIQGGRLPAARFAKKYRIKKDDVIKLLRVKMNEGIRNPLDYR